MTHRFDIRVYWEDTDAGGIVYYANYLRFLERGRTEALRAAGIDQGVVRAEHGVIFVVRRAGIDWLAPARLDDLLQVETHVTGVGGASATLAQAIRRRPAPGSPVQGGAVQGDTAGQSADAMPRKAPGDAAGGAAGQPMDHGPGPLLLQADIKIACMDAAGKPARIPGPLRQRLILMKA